MENFVNVLVYIFYMLNFKILFIYFITLYSIYKIGGFSKFNILLKSNLKLLLTLEILGKVSWSIGVSIVGGFIATTLNLNVLYLMGFWVGIVFTVLGVVVEEFAKRNIKIINK